MFEIILISFFIIVACSFLSLLESSIVFTDELKVQYMLNKNKEKYNDRKKEIIKKIIFKKDNYISSIAIISTAVNILGSSIVGAMTAQYLSTQETLIFMAAFIYSMLIFSKILPKIIAVGKFEFFLDWFAYFVNIVYYFTTPILIFTLFWIKLFKPKQNPISIKELQSIIHYYTEKGAIHSMEETMIEQLLSIKKKNISDLIKNKDPILKLNYKSKIKKYRYAITHNSNKIYVVEKNKELVGIAFYRDLTDLLLNEGEVQHRVSKCLKTAFFIKSKDDLFDAILKFKKNKDRYAIVLNDDNDVAGIVSAKQVYQYALK